MKFIFAQPFLTYLTWDFLSLDKVVEKWKMTKCAVLWTALVIDWKKKNVLRKLFNNVRIRYFSYRFCCCIDVIISFMQEI